jgi:hypothetical protein
VILVIRTDEPGHQEVLDPESLDFDDGRPVPSQRKMHSRPHSFALACLVGIFAHIPISIVNLSNTNLDISSRMRFLCLHGKGTSAKIFQSQTGTRLILSSNIKSKCRC